MFKEFVLFNYESNIARILNVETVYTKIIEKISEIKGAKFPVIFKGDILQNRKLIENRRINILVDLELNNYKDNLNFRNSGLNQVLCRLASLATNEYELRSRDALKSFGLVIGMNPREAKDAVEAISKF